MSASVLFPDPDSRYFPNGDTTFLCTHKVRVPAGTLIRSMAPKDPNDWFPAGRTTVVRIFAASPGFLVPASGGKPAHYQYATATWPGAGGYWKRVALRDVEFLDLPDISAPTPQERQRFDAQLTPQALQDPLLAASLT